MTLDSFPGDRWSGSLREAVPGHLEGGHRTPDLPRPVRESAGTAKSQMAGDIREADLKPALDTMRLSGALQLIDALLTMRARTIPPTINYSEPDPDCDLEYVPNRARPAEMRLAPVNSFALGGA